MPSTSDSASETKSSLDIVLMPYFTPGSRTAAPCLLCSVACSMIADRLKPNLPSRKMLISVTQSSSRTALMICTQVVPFMPPTST